MRVTVGHEVLNRGDAHRLHRLKHHQPTVFFENNATMRVGRRRGRDDRLTLSLGGTAKHNIPFLQQIGRLFPCLKPEAGYQDQAGDNLEYGLKIHPDTIASSARRINRKKRRAQGTCIWIHQPQMDTDEPCGRWESLRNFAERLVLMF